MLQEPPVTLVQAWQRRRRWLTTPLALLALLVFLLGLAVAGLGVYVLWRLAQDRTPYHADAVEHFKYGSIGSEPESGLPYWIWQALPRLFPEAFGGRDDYAGFGFLYEQDEEGHRRDLPVGVARREVDGVELVWLNCAVCHAGTWRASADAAPQLVPAMPANHLDLDRFFSFLLEAGADERLAPDSLLPAMRAAGAEIGPLDELVWRFYVIPRVREGLLQRRQRVLPLLALQPAWGPGRVDTFNPYKLLFKGDRLDCASGGGDAHCLGEAERIGAADFPAVFEQGPRQGMRLHWDGNNASLDERNLSAALGAGVTPETVDHAAIARVKDWLLGLRPPPSPYRPDPEAVERGRGLFMEACADCHGYQGPKGYVFEGAYLGKVEPIAQVGTDPARLDSYTPEFRAYQLAKLFAGTPYRFRHFTKTDGYANAPLDGLWLRAPYLHNGSVPTLADLLEAPEARPAAFVRGLDVLDPARGGFVAPPCDPGVEPAAGTLCFDTGEPGNGKGGHRYGTGLGPAEKADLLAYLLTF
ncbi:MAG: hypothetical protein U1E14_17135 [Geminicoccaceae bacterium]